MKYPRLSRCLAAVVIVTASIFAAVVHGPALAVFTALALAMPAPSTSFGAYINTVDSELLIAKQLNMVLEAFVAALLPVRAFSLGVTNGMTLNELGTDTVLVPYLPMRAAASRNFNAAAGDCYVTDGRAIEKRKVLVDKRKYQSMGITSQQAATMPLLLTLGPAQLAQMGTKLAEDVIADILSEVTAANFPNESVVGAAGAFDTDVMFDVREDANGFKMPKRNRSAILNDAYYTALLKDNKDADKYGNSQARWDAQVPRIAGFDVYDTTEGLDGTTDVDAGIVVFPSAILLAMAPVEPLPSVRRQLDDFQIFTHEESGLSLVYKRGADWKCDNEAEIVEANYGFEKGEEDALLRLVES